jgi:hypothetical protein
LTSSYYLWKWADNQLPGPPGEVFSALLHGKMHPALQPFDARPVVRDLQATAATRHALDEEWDWQIQPSDAADCARFIFLQCPTIPRHGAFRDQFINLVYPWSLSGYAEQQGSLIQCLLPKQNSFEFGEFPEEDQFDIVEDDLPVLLSRIHQLQGDPRAILTNHRNHFVQCYAHRDGFDVEWRENRSLTDFTDYDQWRAGYAQQRNTERRPRVIRECRMINSEWRAVRIQEYRHEKLRFSDALRIFQVFLRGEPRPAQYQWRSIRQELEQTKHHRRKPKPHE